MLAFGNTRGNGSQLATYLLTKAENDSIVVLDIRGTNSPHDLRKSLLEMSLTSELSNSDKGLYHAQICPAYGEDKLMSKDDWLRAADILEAEIGYVGAKRAIVLHDKKSRLHAHVVFERYDHERGVMKSDSFNYSKHQIAKRKMELEFNHKLTPMSNAYRPILKTEVTQLWKETNTAEEFIEAIAAKGYAVATGTTRPYALVDHLGVSCNLIRQLDGVNTREVRERFRTTKLVKEKVAIQAVRDRQNADKLDIVQERAINKMIDQLEKTVEKEKSLPNPAANDNKKSKAVANDNSNAPYQMKASITLNPVDTAKAKKQMQDAIEKDAANELIKQKVRDKLNEARLKRAREFRDNERDM